MLSNVPAINRETCNLVVRIKDRKNIVIEPMSGSTIRKVNGLAGTNDFFCL